MRSIQSWLDEYSESHQNSCNQLIHWLCVPAIMLSVLGLLWSLPVPAIFTTLSPLFNWATILLLIALIFYYMLSVKLALGMLMVTVTMLAFIWWVESLPAPLWVISVLIFVIAWLGQFIGHLVEGRKPSFFKDLQFLLIGPLWLLAKTYRKFGIGY